MVVPPRPDAHQVGERPEARSRWPPKAGTGVGPDLAGDDRRVCRAAVVERYRDVGTRLTVDRNENGTLGVEPGQFDGTSDTPARARSPASTPGSASPRTRGDG